MCQPIPKRSVRQALLGTQLGRPDWRKRNVQTGPSFSCRPQRPVPVSRACSDRATPQRRTVCSQMKTLSQHHENSSVFESKLTKARKPKQGFESYLTARLPIPLFVSLIRKAKGIFLDQVVVLRDWQAEAAIETLATMRLSEACTGSLTTMSQPEAKKPRFCRSSTRSAKH